MADDSSLDDLRRVIMVSRYLDRIAAISIDAAFRLTFLLTGQRLCADDLADADEDELESCLLYTSMRIKGFFAGRGGSLVRSR